MTEERKDNISNEKENGHSVEASTGEDTKTNRSEGEKVTDAYANDSLPKNDNKVATEDQAQKFLEAYAEDTHDASGNTETHIETTSVKVEEKIKDTHSATDETISSEQSDQKRKHPTDDDTNSEKALKKTNLEDEPPAVNTGHSYLNNMDITNMTYEEYLTAFKDVQERSKAKFQQAQQQLRQLQQQQQRYQQQQRMQQMNYMHPMMGGPMNMGQMGPMGGPMGMPHMGGYGPASGMMGMGPGMHM